MIKGVCQRRTRVGNSTCKGPEPEVNLMLFQAQRGEYGE